MAEGLAKYLVDSVLSPDLPKAKKYSMAPMGAKGSSSLGAMGNTGSSAMGALPEQKTKTKKV